MYGFVYEKKLYINTLSAIEHFCQYIAPVALQGYAIKAEMLYFSNLEKTA